jgi:preprotein translocase subunit SecA
MKRFFGSANERILRSFEKTVAEINKIEPSLQALSDAQLQARTPWLKDRLAAGETLDNILVDAFATTREAARRLLGHRHFDVQLLGGMVLHKGMFAEMKTGEGKTLVMTLPVYLNALTGQGVHVVTVNDYLAQRDSEWMGQIYRFLGLTVGCIVHGLSDAQRQEQYNADVTYGTNNEFGFDYLRDNMKFRLSELVQRPFNYAIVDEADSILIDEARTPLIISGPSEDSSDLYGKVDALMPHLTEEDYEKDEKQRSVTLTEKGTLHIEKLLEDAGLLGGASLYDAHNIGLVHHVNQALQSHKMFQRDVDYIVKDNKVIIIDEFTGRMMEGRRYSDGLHQALEAKEHVEIQMENQTLASITFQNYFRLYPKLAGMSGTALTEANELMDIYKLEVVALPTNVPCQRQDLDDEIYRTEREKFNAIVSLIKQLRTKNQPILVGTVSIEKSEKLSRVLQENQIPHQVLNARHHQKESEIIADAGRPGAVTIATNMAGRGTDIKLGGSKEIRLEHALEGVVEPAERSSIEAALHQEIDQLAHQAREAGGLFVIGTERHESRRIDNQLRGRTGRQGDPGASRFYLSLEDDLLRIFGSDRLKSLLEKMGFEEGEAITHKMINRAIEKAQTRVEARNYDIRKQLLKYDDVMNEQRKVIYSQRRELMLSTEVTEEVTHMRHEIIEKIIESCIPKDTFMEQWNLKGLHAEALRLLALDLPIDQWKEEEGLEAHHILERVTQVSDAHMAEKFTLYGAQIMEGVQKSLILRFLDQAWKEHLLGLDHLRQGIHLRAYGQRDPLNEYKHEAFSLFHTLLWKIKEGVTSAVSHLDLTLDNGTYDSDSLLPDDGWLAPPVDGDPQGPESFHKGPSFLSSTSEASQSSVSRNSPCPCGSGKKFKHCHGKL